MSHTISEFVLKKCILFQKDEITSSIIYQRLAKIEKNPQNAEVLISIAAEEKKHAARWASVTEKIVSPSWSKVIIYVMLARFFGLTFAIKKLEKGEADAQTHYLTVLDVFPDVKDIIAEENSHEEKLIAMIDEERLRYAGSVVLGLNDALVELTGALAGFTFAFQNTRLIALTGLITGISASFSMASSEYLSQRSEGDGSVSPIKSAVYTGTAYIITVVLLVLPFFLTSNYLIALGITLLMVVLIIISFNYYLCTAKDLSFKKHFIEMLVVSFGVTLLSFGVGLIVKRFLGLDL